MDVKYYFFDDLPVSATSVIEEYVMDYRGNIMVIIEPPTEFYMVGGQDKGLNTFSSENKDIPLFFSNYLEGYSPLYLNRGVLSFSMGISLGNPLFSPRRFLGSFIKNLSKMYKGDYSLGLGQVYKQEKQVLASYCGFNEDRFSYNGWISVNPKEKKGVTNNCLRLPQGELGTTVEEFVSSFPELIGIDHINFIKGDNVEEVRQDILGLCEIKEVDGYV